MTSIRSSGGLALAILIALLAPAMHAQTTNPLAKVMITEVSWAEPDGVEITNFSNTTVDLSSWSVRLRIGGTTALSGSLGVTLAPGERVLVLEPAGAAPEAFGSIRKLRLFSNLSANAQPMGAALFDGSGINRDEVRVDSIAGVASPGFGGSFRGRIARNPGDISAERIEGLDSDSGRDWVTTPLRSFGLDNIAAGVRGTDPVATPSVLINEIDDSPDMIELRNAGGSAVNLRDWYFLESSANGVSANPVRPSDGVNVILPAGGFLVVGEGVRPAEMPAGVAYFDILALSQNILFTANEYSVALYTSLNQLVDLVRTTQTNGQMAHNDPRMPSAYDDFRGVGVRTSVSANVLARRTVLDSNQGSDWQMVFGRTLGAPNTDFLGRVGHSSVLDVRLDGTSVGGGLTSVLSAGPGAAGYRWSFAVSFQVTNGNGPFFGLGADAYANYLALYNAAPWFGFLDAQGNARLDLPPAAIAAGLRSEDLYFLQNPITSALEARTYVIPWTP